MKKIFPIFCILLLALTSCIDPYILNLDEYESLLVVDGMITDEPVSYKIKLSRTFQNEEALLVAVSNAEVSVQDESGNITVFQEKDPGIYRSDSAYFTGRVGGIYTLLIKTDDLLEYESDPCLMTGVPEIDSIYFAYDRELINNGTEEEEGIRIYLDASNKNEVCKYFRWEFDEVWKFQTPYPVAYKYLGGGKIESILVENHTCWKYRQSNDVIIHSTELQKTGQVSRQALRFIASNKSDRLRKQYSIHVKQYSLSKNEYEFWNNLKQVSESGGDIFEKQPFSVIGNIHCINRENEKVLGYFQVSAIKKMRKYITYGQLVDLDIPFYKYPCSSIEYGPYDLYGPSLPYPVPPEIYDAVYRRFINLGYVFIRPDDMIGPGGLILNTFVFATKECSDCSLTGSPDKPDFWIDIY